MKITWDAHFTEGVEHQKVSVKLELGKRKTDLNVCGKEIRYSSSNLPTLIIFKLLFMQVIEDPFKRTRNQ